MGENKVLVSIIVPIYGTEKYLHACVDSIINQTYKNLEIILVDDQSPDRCPEICDEYEKKDKRIKVIHQKNKGVSGARNTGIECATGSYIMFVDSDDEICFDTIEVLLKDALEYDADVVSAEFELLNQKDSINESSEQCQRKVYVDDKPIILSLEGKENTGSACAKLYKFDFVRELRFVEGKHIGEDIFYVFQCYLKKPVLVAHNITVYKQNVRIGSGSKQVFSDKFLSILYFLERKKELISIHFPELMKNTYSLEVRNNLQILDVLCSTKDKRYLQLQRKCIKKVCELYEYHNPANAHHEKLAWIVKHRLYNLYKLAVRIKYYM